MAVKTTQTEQNEDRAGAEGGRDDHVGLRLKPLRLEHRYSIRKLASLAGVSPSLISEVERGKVEPSISVLKRLASALDTTLVYFFSESNTGPSRVIRRQERRRLESVQGGHGVSFELLAPDHAEAMEPIYGRYEIGATMGEEPVTHAGEEWGLVLKGRLKVWLGDEIYFLDPGDSIWFESTIPHRLANVAEETTEYVWVNSPKSF